MADATNTPQNIDGAPLDFAAYEAWHDKGRDKGDAGKSADTDADKAKASKTSTESETAQTEAGKDGTDGNDDGEKPQKKSGFQRRIDRLNQKLGASQARIAELERGTQGGNATAPKTEQAKPAAAAEAPGKPEAKNFDSYEAYVEALADWKLDTREKTRAAEKAQRDAEEAQNALIAEHQATFEARKKLYPDWQEKVSAATDIPITAVMNTFIVESEYRADLGYFLAENPDEAARIGKLTPIRQAAELGRIEATFNDGEADDKADKKPATDTPKPRVSKTPAPPKTVKAQAETSEPDPADFAAWEAWRNKQPGATIRRR